LAALRARSNWSADMKCSLLATCIAGLLIAPMPVQAVMHLASDGRGEVLVFPYYTSDGGNQTLLSVVNSTSRGKAVKVRFREGSNSRSVLDFNIYLAPFDVWTGSVFDPQTTQRAALVTRDNSCTVPAIKTSTVLPTLSNGVRYVGFSNYTYSGSNNDSGEDSVARAREGHFEMIEMGEVTNATRQSLRAISPNASGVPLNCAQIENAWRPDILPNDAYWLSASAMVDMAAPRGGLHGFAAMVDTLGGTMLGYGAEAIAGFSTVVQHTGPGDELPNLGSAVGTDGVVVARVVHGDGEAMLRYPAAQAIDAVSAVFTARALYNDFVSSAAVGGASEWVMTFPTKQFYTDLTAGPAIAPFVNAFPRSGTQGSAPLSFAIDVRDRDGTLRLCEPTSSATADCAAFGGVPPPPSMNTTLNWAVNVLSFGQTQSGATSVFGSSRRLEVPLGQVFAGNQASDGSAGINFYAPWRDGSAYAIAHSLRPDSSGARLAGLPVVGFWASRYTNTAVTPGVLANYSGTVRHQITQLDLSPPE
jgi:hypothetical protein